MLLTQGEPTVQQYLVRGMDMDSPFSAEAWATLSADGRIRLCRSMATKARSLGAAAASKDRPVYSDLALRWEMLATEMASAGAEQLTP